MANALLLMFKGALMGIATLIPGVSGGTMGIILGIYDKIIHAMSSFFKDWKKNVLFLLEVGIGSLIGIALFSNLIEAAMEKFEKPMIYLFLGVICGGLPVLYKKAKAPDGKKIDLLYLIGGFLIVIPMALKSSMIVNMANSTGILSFIFLLFAGFIIAVALILPGISTSFMLLAMGLYDITLKAVSTFDVSFLIPIVLGCVIGIITTTKLLENMMNKHPRQTYLMILGFVASSILQVFPGIPQGIEILYCILSAILGFFAIRLMSKYIS